MSKMKEFLLLLALGLVSTEKLDRTYLPPPGSKYSGGSPGDLVAPFEVPKEAYTTISPFTTGQGDRFITPGDTKLTVGTDRIGVPIAGQRTNVISANSEPNRQLNNIHKAYNVPTTTTSYAFTQTTTYPTPDGFETTISPIATGSPFDGLPGLNTPFNQGLIANQQNVLDFGRPGVQILPGTNLPATQNYPGQIGDYGQNLNQFQHNYPNPSISTSVPSTTAQTEFSFLPNQGYQHLGVQPTLDVQGISPTPAYLGFQQRIPPQHNLGQNINQLDPFPNFPSTNTQQYNNGNAGSTQTFVPSSNFSEIPYITSDGNLSLTTPHPGYPKGGPNQNVYNQGTFSPELQLQYQGMYPIQTPNQNLIPTSAPQITQYVDQYGNVQKVIPNGSPSPQQPFTQVIQTLDQQRILANNKPQSLTENLNIPYQSNFSQINGDFIKDSSTPTLSPTIPTLAQPGIQINQQAKPEFTSSVTSTQGSNIPSSIQESIFQRNPQQIQGPQTYPIDSSRGVPSASLFAQQNGFDRKPISVPSIIPTPESSIPLQPGHSVFNDKTKAYLPSQSYQSKFSHSTVPGQVGSTSSIFRDNNMQTIQKGISPQPSQFVPGLNNQNVNRVAFPSNESNGNKISLLQFPSSNSVFNQDAYKKGQGQPSLENSSVSTSSSIYTSSTPSQVLPSLLPSAPFNTLNQDTTLAKIQPRPDRPNAESERNAEILDYYNVLTPDGFAYSFDTSNGIHADENGTAVGGVKADGSYSYIGDDGKFYKVVYTADENGFKPQGDHLPTPPPIPEAIQRVIEQAAKDREAGILHDGFYDEAKYGHKKYQKAKNKLPVSKGEVTYGSDIPYKHKNGEDNKGLNRKFIKKPITFDLEQVPDDYDGSDDINMSNAFRDASTKRPSTNISTRPVTKMSGLKTKYKENVYANDYIDNENQQPVEPSSDSKSKLNKNKNLRRPIKDKNRQRLDGFLIDENENDDELLGNFDNEDSVPYNMDKYKEKSSKLGPKNNVSSTNMRHEKYPITSHMNTNLRPHVNKVPISRIDDTYEEDIIESSSQSNTRKPELSIDSENLNKTYEQSDLPTISTLNLKNIDKPNKESTRYKNKETFKYRKPVQSNEGTIDDIFEEKSQLGRPTATYTKTQFTDDNSGYKYLPPESNFDQVRIYQNQSKPQTFDIFQRPPKKQSSNKHSSVSKHTTLRPFMTPNVYNEDLESNEEMKKDPPSRKPTKTMKPVTSVFDNYESTEDSNEYFDKEIDEEEESIYSTPAVTMRPLKLEIKESMRHPSQYTQGHKNVDTANKINKSKINQQNMQSTKHRQDGKPKIPYEMYESVEYKDSSTTIPEFLQGSVRGNSNRPQDQSQFYTTTYEPDKDDSFEEYKTSGQSEPSYKTSSEPSRNPPLFRPSQDDKFDYSDSDELSHIPSSTYQPDKLKSILRKPSRPSNLVTSNPDSRIPPSSTEIYSSKPTAAPVDRYLIQSQPTAGTFTSEPSTQFNYPSEDLSGRPAVQNIPSSTYRPNYFDIPQVTQPGVNIDGFGRRINRPGSLSISSSTTESLPFDNETGLPSTAVYQDAGVGSPGRESYYNTMPKVFRTNETRFGQPALDLVLTQRPVELGPTSTKIPSNLGPDTTKKVIGEDFRGPKQPQRFDAKTGYHY